MATGDQLGVASSNTVQILLTVFRSGRSLFGTERGGINFNPGYFLPSYEVIYLIAKNNFKLTAEGIARGDVWNITQDSNNPHPAPFPVELAETIIRSTEAQLILDPFMGSGTTAIASHRAGRNFIGIDNSDEYCRLARKRFDEIKKQSQLI